MFHQVRLKSGESGASVSACSHLKVEHLKREGTLLLGHLLGACSASLCHSSFTHLFEQHLPDDLHIIFNISRTFPCTLDSKCMWGPNKVLAGELRLKLNASGGQSFKLPFRCLDKDFLGPVRVVLQFLRYLYLKPLESFYIKRGCCLSSISIFFSFSFSVGCI